MLYFEDFSEGETFELSSQTLTRTDIVEFAERWDPQPFHLGEDHGKDTVFDGLVASGLHTLCLGSRMMITEVLNESANMGGKGITDIGFHRPVEPGDTLTGRLDVVEKTATHPARGDVTFELTMTTSDGSPVMSATYISILGRRSSA
jgi:acyl dehydratase